MSVFHAIYASTVFVVAYALITTERFNKTMVALAGATAMFFLPVINSHEVWYSEDTGIDWDVIFLVLVTALGSAFLDNVTTVLLIAPVTLLVCERLAVSAVPFLIVEAFAANIGGAATLVGDPTSMIIGTGADLSFVSFLVHMAPVVIIVLGALVLLLPVLFPGAFTVDDARIADGMSLD